MCATTGDRDKPGPPAQFHRHEITWRAIGAAAKSGEHCGDDDYRRAVAPRHGEEGESDRYFIADAQALAAEALARGPTRRPSTAPSTKLPASTAPILPPFQCSARA